MISTALPRRLAGLDAWRATLLTGGLFYHALPAGHDGLLFVVIEYLSSHFRMGAFFAISAFITGIVAGRRDARSWLRRRLARLAPPLLTGALVTVSSMGWLQHQSISGAADAAILITNWYHLWFLAALIAYLPLTTSLAFGRVGELLHAWLTGIAASVGSMQIVVIIAVGIASFGMLTIGAALIVAVPILGETTLRYLPLALCYLPVYAMGLLFGRYEDLRHASLKDWRLPIILIAVLIVSEIAVRGFSPPGWATAAMTLDRFTRALLPVLGTLLILRSAMTIRHIPEWLGRLCDASLTIYIVQLPVLAALPPLSAHLPLHPYIRYIYMVAAVGALSWAFHMFVIARSRTLMWLFNGRELPVTASQAPA